VNSVGLRDETSAGEVGTMPLSGAATLVFLGGIVYAMLSGDWGERSARLQPRRRVAGAGLAQCCAEPARPSDRVGALLCGVLTIMFIALRMALGVTYR
jgi:hypothetical protein